MAERNELLRTQGLLHGGACVALIDTVIILAARSSCPKGFYDITAQLNVNFTRPAKEADTLVATADVQHLGDKTAVVTCKVNNQSGSLIATATGTSMFVPLPDSKKLGHTYHPTEQTSPYFDRSEAQPLLRHFDRSNT